VGDFLNGSTGRGIRRLAFDKQLAGAPRRRRT